MSQIRQNILTGEWVIYAANRNGKPYDFIRKTKPKTVDRKCPFCPGSEDMTPEAVYSNEKDGKWTIRVFPNMYPAVDDERADKNGDEFYTCVMGSGIHEVVVDTDDHEQSIHDFTLDHLTEVIEVIRARYAAIRQCDGVEYVQVFKNCGPDAGASINHSHWQIIGGPVPGIQQVLEEHNCAEYYNKHGKCLMCDMVRHEKQSGERVIAENELFIAFVPFAAKMSFEVYIMPKKHMSGFEEMNKESIKQFSEILKVMLDKVKLLFDGVSYNICFQDLAKSDSGKSKHWYARILPRIGAPAGYEFATGSFINPVLPEAATDKLRNIEREGGLSFNRNLKRVCGCGENTDKKL